MRWNQQQPLREPFHRDAANEKQQNDLFEKFREYTPAPPHTANSSAPQSYGSGYRSKPEPSEQQAPQNDGLCDEKILFSNKCTSE